MRFTNRIEFLAIMALYLRIRMNEHRVRLGQTTAIKGAIVGGAITIQARAHLMLIRQPLMATGDQSPAVRMVEERQQYTEYLMVERLLRQGMQRGRAERRHLLGSLVGFLRALIAGDLLSEIGKKALEGFEHGSSYLVVEESRMDLIEGNQVATVGLDDRAAIVDNGTGANALHPIEPDLIGGVGNPRHVGNHIQCRTMLQNGVDVTLFGGFNFDHYFTIALIT